MRGVRERFQARRAAVQSEYEEKLRDLQKSRISSATKSGSAKTVPEYTGSIDARPVRELIQELLEGGEDAFERRRRKYGF